MLRARANYFTVNYQLMDHTSPPHVPICRGESLELTYHLPTYLSTLKSRLHSGSIVTWLLYEMKREEKRDEAKMRGEEKERERKRVENVSKVSLCPMENARKWSVFFHLERTA